MQRRNVFVASMAALCLASLVIAQDSGVRAVIGNVFLQNTTPGTAQVGHATITGTFRAGQVFVQQGSSVTIPVVGNSTATGSGDAIGGSFSSAQMQGIGVRGTSTASPGAGIGVLGVGRGANSFGLVGRLEGDSGSQGAAIRAEVPNGTAKGVSSLTNAGTAGQFISNNGTGLSAQSTSVSNGVGLLATHPVDQVGVTSIAGLFKGKTIGLQARAESTVQSETMGVTWRVSQY